MKKIECEIIRDLCPLYEKDEVSEVTKKVIEEHVVDCQTCRNYYEQSKEKNEVKKKEQEAYYVKTASRLRRRKRFFLMKGLIAFSAILIVFNSFFKIGRMVTGQMAPTVSIGDMFVINKGAYLFSNPEKEDVVYYKNPQRMYNAIGRIIGCPGDHIIIREGVLYVNDVIYSRYSDQYVQLPEGESELDQILDMDEYFIMGDCVEDSCDSRYVGTFMRKNIAGKVVLPRDHKEEQQKVTMNESGQQYD